MTQQAEDNSVPEASTSDVDLVAMQHAATAAEAPSAALAEVPPIVVNLPSQEVLTGDVVREGETLFEMGVMDPIEPKTARSARHYMGKQSMTILRVDFDPEVVAIRRIVAGPKSLDPRKLGFGDRRPTPEDWNKIVGAGVGVPSEHLVAVVLENVSDAPAKVGVKLFVRAGGVAIKQTQTRSPSVRSGKPPPGVVRKGVPSPKPKMGKSVSAPLPVTTARPRPRLTTDPMRPSAAAPPEAMMAPFESGAPVLVPLQPHLVTAILQTLDHNVLLSSMHAGIVETALRGAIARGDGPTTEHLQAAASSKLSPVVVPRDVAVSLLTKLRMAPHVLKADPIAGIVHDACRAALAPAPVAP